MARASAAVTPVGARVELVATLPVHVYGKVTASERGITVESKVRRSSKKFTRVTYPFSEVIAYQEGTEDAGGYAVVVCSMDITENRVIQVEDADAITTEDGWLVVPQEDGAVRINDASAEARAVIRGNIFMQEADGTTTDAGSTGAPKRRGRPPKAATNGADTGDAPPKRRGRPPKAATNGADAATGTDAPAASAPPKKRGRPSKADVAAREAAAAAEAKAAAKAAAKAEKKAKKGKKGKKKAESNWND